MKYTIFLGCTTPARQMNYEQSARAVAKVLGVDFEEAEFGCCGFPMESLDEVKALSMAVMNLKIAAEKGNPVVSLCSACVENLTRAEHVLEEDESTKKKVNSLLKKHLDTEYRGE